MPQASTAQLWWTRRNWPRAEVATNTKRSYVGRAFGSELLALWCCCTSAQEGSLTSFAQLVELCSERSLAALVLALAASLAR